MNEFTYQSSLVNLNYFEGPDNGAPLLLLHGNSNRWQSFKPIIPELINNFHVYALDFRGHGKSGRTPGYYKLQDHLQDVSSFIKEHIKKPVILFGHSLGGMTKENHWL